MKVIKLKAKDKDTRDEAIKALNGISGCIASKSGGRGNWLKVSVELNETADMILAESEKDERILSTKVESETTEEKKGSLFSSLSDSTSSKKPKKTTAKKVESSGVNFQCYLYTGMEDSEGTRFTVAVPCVGTLENEAVVLVYVTGAVAKCTQYIGGGETLDFPSQKKLDKVGKKHFVQVFGKDQTELEGYTVTRRSGNGISEFSAGGANFSKIFGRDEYNITFPRR